MAAKKKEEAEMSNEERIGFHKGALQTLVGERNELLKVVQVAESLMQAHIQELDKLGVKFDQESK
tara:strand:- start:534 stop:728 length:195 start_codon:yes stop_codon:yes gene_type:complete